MQTKATLVDFGSHERSRADIGWTGAYGCMDGEPISSSLGGGAWLEPVVTKDYRLAGPCQGVLSLVSDHSSISYQRLKAKEPGLWAERRQYFPRGY
jgi:hypothetical protein